MATDKEKIHQLVDSCQDDFLLEEAKAILETSQDRDWWDDLSTDEKNLLKESELQYERKEFVTHTELLKRYEEWKKK